MTGKLYGIGVGIGDPEDMTLKAVRLIKESDVLILPRKDISKCRAYQIALQSVPEIDRIETLALEFEMVKDKAERDRNHRQIYEKVKCLIEAGKTVTFLTIGDPAIYSTYSYIAELAEADGIETVAVSAVSSITACANRLGITLCDDRQQLHVLPDADDLKEALALPGTKVIMKSGRQIGKIKEILKDRDASVYAVSDCGTDKERCFCSIGDIPEEENYMLTIIVKEKE